jgi:hypothetical protein
MRNLTQQEIEQAPTDCTHYFIVGSGDGAAFFIEHPSTAKKHGFDSQPIPRKEFDIEPYKHWCDPTNDNGGPIDYCYYDEIGREKAIEIAKHFKLIPEDSQ